MKKSFLGVMATAMGLGAMFINPFKDAKDVQDKHEGGETQPLFYSNNSNPIYIPSRSQRVKSKRLRASNKKQGRA